MSALTNLIAAPADKVLSGANGWNDLAATYSVGAAHYLAGNYSRITEVVASGNQRRYYLGPAGAKTLQCTVSKSFGGSGTRYIAFVDNAAAHIGIWDMVTGANTRSVGTGTVCYFEDRLDHWLATMVATSGSLNSALISIGHSSDGTATAYAGSTSNWIDVSDVVLANEIYEPQSPNGRAVRRQRMRIGIGI